MTEGNRHAKNLPYKFNTRRDLWLRIITNPWVMGGVLVLFIVLMMVTTR